MLLHAGFGKLVFLSEMNFKQCSLSAFAAAAIPSASPSALCMQPGEESACSGTAATLAGTLVWDRELQANAWLKAVKAAPFRMHPAVRIYPWSAPAGFFSLCG